ncbi:MAG: MATE family efflux transporter [Bacilli bacterium]
MKNLDLGKEKIRKLIKIYAIPCVISMIVAALYNIVDQIFIGWSDAGVFGNAATNIVYPFTVISLAFALLIGDGAAAVFNLSLGSKDQEKANKSIGNAIILLIGSSILLTIIGLVFNKQILNLFGGNPNEVICYTYAKDYLRIICYGLPFYIIGQGLNATIRCDGSPKYAMVATIIGAISNIVLDPVFIFIFKLGVKGAALATIIGQILTFTVSIIYLKKSNHFKISKDSIKIDKDICQKLLSLGLASLITQISIVIIIAVANNIVGKYGYNTYASTGKAFGVVTPLAVIGICMKVFGIVISIVVGISLGGMPIIGYNMGAGNNGRVKQTVKYILIINAIIGLLSFCLFEFCPTYIINIFGGSNSPEYIEYAKYCLNIFMGGIILTCLTKSISIILQSMGSSFKSTLLALSRDVIFFVPSIIIIVTLSKSVVTMLWSAVVADVLAFILGIILLKFEFEKISELEYKVIKSNESINNNKCLLKNKVVITISREYGSGGHFVGKLLAEKLGIKFYNKEIIYLTAEKFGYNPKYIELNEEQGTKSNIYYSTDNKLFQAEAKVIENIANDKSCIIVGRCADFILRNKKNTIKVFLYSDMKSKIKRTIKYYGISKNNAEKEIFKINKQRAKHYKHFTNQDWNSFENFDLAINVDKLGVEDTAEMLKNIILNIDKNIN